MEESESPLQEYQLTLREISDASTTNERRHELLEYLTSFDGASNFDFLCNALQASSDDLSVLMFSIVKLESCIMKELPFASPLRRRQLLQTVFYFTQHYEVTGKQSCAVQKLMSIGADIIRHSDEADAREYFTQISEFVTRERTRHFGLKLLKVTVEELVESSRCRTLPHERLQCMKTIAIQQASHFYDIIIGLISEKLIVFLPFAYPVKDTPPRCDISSVLGHFMTVLEATDDLFNELVGKHAEELSLELGCLSILVKNVEADTLLEGHSLHVIYVLAFVGLQLTVQSLSPVCINISESAVNCLQQLSERQWLTQSVKKSEMAQFLTCAFSSLERAPQPLDIPQFHRTLRLLHLYAVSFYAKQLEIIPGRDAFFHSQLMCLLKSNEVDTFRLFCDCWASMFDSLISRLEMTLFKSISPTNAYLPEGFCKAFGLAMLNRLVNFEGSDEEDEPAEGIELFDNGSVPGICLEMFSLLISVDLEPQWHIIMDEYARTAAAARHCITRVSEAGLESTLNDMEVIQITSHVRQFRQVLKAACCLASPFTAGVHTDYFERCYEFLTRHCEITTTFVRSLFTTSAHPLGVLEGPIFSAMVSVLLCFRAYVPWLSSFYADAQRTGNRNEEVSFLVSTALNAVAAVLRDREFRGELTRAAVLTLRSILLTIRPHSFVLTMNGIQSLYRQSVDGLYESFPEDILCVLYVSLANYLILPWYNAVGDDQEWSQRRPIYQQLVRSVLADYFALIDAKEPVPYETAAPVIKKAAPLIVAQLESIEHEGVETKQMCYDVMRPIGKGSLSLLLSYKRHLDCAQSLLRLLSRLLSTLVMQLGLSFTKQLTSTLFGLCNSADFYDSLQEKTEEATNVLECFVSVLSTIVVQNNPKFSDMLPEIIAFATGPLHSIVLRSDVEVIQSYYELLGKIICVGWRRYFGYRELFADAKEELRSFLNIFCAGIVEQELEAAKVAIAQLNMMNARHAFYKSDVFMSEFYFDFVSTLFVALVNREHDILLDDICETLALLGCLTLDRFCGETLPVIMETSCGITREQATQLCTNLFKCQEIPAFSVMLKAVVHDTRFCRLLNSLSA